MTSAGPGGATTLPRGVRIGYGSGSVATGAFGTVPGLVPGLMLLPHPTDELGIAALSAQEALVAASLDRLQRPVRSAR